MLPSADFPALRVLVADDEPDHAESLRILLELWGHEVRVARDGAEALTAAEQFQPHLALLDFNMPKLSGGEVARRLRQLPGQEDLVLVLITANAEDAAPVVPYRPLFNYFIRKPYNLTQLERFLARASRASVEPGDTDEAPGT